MELRSLETVVVSLDHLQGFCLAAPPALDGALAESHVFCGESFAENDRAVMNRGFVLSRMDLLPTPSGLVTTQSEGPRRPRKTTWLHAPSDKGIEPIMVNVVKALGGGKYKLVHGEAGAIPDFVRQPGFWPNQDAVVDVMLAIIWSLLPQNRGSALRMSATVYLIGGYLDRDSRIFHAVDEQLLLPPTTYGGGNSSPVHIEPAGPSPRVSRA